MNSQFALAFYHRAECFQHLGQLQEAIADLKCARELFPAESRDEIDQRLIELGTRL
jgi:hypothetical protein